jgi:hypothetical protein
MTDIKFAHRRVSRMAEVRRGDVRLAGKGFA